MLSRENNESTSRYNRGDLKTCSQFSPKSVFQIQKSSCEGTKLSSVLDRLTGLGRQEWSADPTKGRARFEPPGLHTTELTD